MTEAPLPFGNAPARWYYVLLKGLVERNYEVRALAVVKESEVEAVRKSFPPDRYNIQLFQPSSSSGLIQKLHTLRRPHSYMFSQDFLKKFAQEASQGFDILHLEQIWSGWLGLKYREKALLNLHHYHGEDLRGLVAHSLKEKFQHLIMVKTEDHLIRSLKHFRAFSPFLLNKIKEINSKALVKVIPIGMDISLYPYVEDHARTNNLTMALFGNLTWTPNVISARRLLEKIWPRIKAKVPNARLTIAGWSARKTLSKYLSVEDVQILEDVPDMKPYFESTDVLFYAPEFGSGMKIKILEAMAYGLPVVTNQCGVEGLPAIDGIHFSFGQSDDDLTHQAVQLLTDIPRQNRQRRAARNLIEKHCSPAATLDSLEAIYDQM
jgi:glycosyltransferase involved in cell wall biosynthesis